MGSSGGGGAGKIEYPAYLQTMHGLMMNSGVDVLDTSMYDLLNEAIASNPFADAGISIYTGRGILNNYGADALPSMNAMVAGVIDALNNYNPETDLYNSLQAAKEYVDNVVDLNASADKAVAAFSDSIEPDFALERAKYDANMTNLGAVLSNAYVQGKTMLVSRKAERVATYDAELRHKMTLVRADMIHQLTVDLNNKKFAKLTFTKEVYLMAVESVKMTIMNEREYTQHYIDWMHQKSLWKFTAYDYGFKAMASISGNAAVIPQKMSNLGSVLSGAFGGAAMGMQFGGMPGAAIGGIVGGLGGILGS